LTKKNEKKSESESLTLSDIISSFEEQGQHRSKAVADLENAQKKWEELIQSTTDKTEKRLYELWRAFTIREHLLYINEEMDLRILRTIQNEIEHLKRKSKRRKVQVTTAEEMNKLINDAVAKKFATLYDIEGHGAMYGH
jgi:uncharacterized protein YlxW (UPF0749 family)